jgi:hypothetical protein
MKTKRRFGVMSILLVVVVLVSLLAMGTTVAAEEEKEALVGDSGGTFVVTNGIYTLSVQDNVGETGVGTYTISTGAAHPNPNQNIFYAGAAQSPWSTYLTVRVYDTLMEYVSTTSGPAPSGGYTVMDLDDCSPLVTAIDSTIITTWMTPDNLAIEQVTAIEGTTLSDSRVRVTTTVTNNDMIAHSVGIRYEWDIMIDGEDGSWFAERIPDGPWLDLETEWVSPAFERYEIVNDPASPIFSVFGTAAGPAVLAPTPPDLLQFADWFDVYSRAFDYTPTGQNIGGDDSAIAYYWGSNEGNQITLAPGENVSVTALVFAVPPVNTPPSTCPVTVTSTESPTPTISWAYFDVEGDLQVEYEVEVWTDPGGTGTNMWDPPIGIGTDTSVVYGGDPLVAGDTYYARVRAYDGTDWGDWCETSWVFTPEGPQPPPKVPGITGWGILAAVVTLGGLMLVARRRGFARAK